MSRKQRLVTFTLCLAASVLAPVSARAATYYVDFDEGDDNASGTSAEDPFKHAPGDAEAQGNAALTLVPGDIVLFRGAVRYRGSIISSADGTADQPITYSGQGFGEGRAVLTGAEPLSGWTLCPSAEACGGNPRWAELYCTFAPEGVASLDSNLHEDGEFLWLAQDPDMPDPYFADTPSAFYELPEGAMTVTSLVDPNRFNQADPTYWDGSALLLWVLPNIVVPRAITSYIPAENRVTYEETNDPSGYDRYSIFNSPHALDSPGEYWFDDGAETDGTHRVCLWPRSGGDPEGRIEISIRRFGFDLSGTSHVTIEGFVIEQYSGSGLTHGLGVGDVSAAYMTNEGITIQDNEIRHNRHADSGYGGIYLSGCVDCLVSGNLLEENAQHAGIFVADGQNVVVSDNTVIRAGGTGIRFYGCSSSVAVGNVVTGGHGCHANGMTFYLGCDGIVAARNLVTDSNIALTLQESSNLTFFGNVFDGAGRSTYVVADWGDLTGSIRFLNNTILGAENHCSVLLDDGPSVLLRNNILDGGGSVTERDHNLYVGLCWNQEERYGWAPGETEIVAAEEQTVFSDDDRHLAAESPAVDTAADPGSALPSGSGVDFTLDMDGEPRPQGLAWDMGAYEHLAGGGPSSDEKKGCGCRLPGSSSASPSVLLMGMSLLLLLVLLGAGRRARRSSKTPLLLGCLMMTAAMLWLLGTGCTTYHMPPGPGKPSAQVSFMISHKVAVTGGNEYWNKARIDSNELDMGSALFGPAVVHTQVKPGKREFMAEVYFGRKMSDLEMPLAWCGRVIRPYIWAGFRYFILFEYLGRQGCKITCSRLSITKDGRRWVHCEGSPAAPPPAPSRTRSESLPL